jgi:TolB-like protein/Tfp pilus assembly protein PilF
MGTAFDSVGKLSSGNKDTGASIGNRTVTGSGAYETVTQHDVPPDVAPLQPAAPAASLVPPASYSAFLKDLKQALRNFNRPDLLERSLLLRSHLFTAPDPGPADLQDLLRDASERLFASARDEKLRHVVAFTYFEAAMKQEVIADRLHLPFGTYRHHLGTALDRMGQWLWQREQAVATKVVAFDARKLGSARSDVFAPPRLSIVVLPFINHEPDRHEQDYFVDGITESLTTDLSRIPGAFVIACYTAFSYKGKSIDVRHIGRELGVRYVLEGSVAIGAERIRVNAQLIDAEIGANVWAERFDKSKAELFDMQNEITTRIARSVDIEIIAAETRRAQRERGDNPDATDLIMHGRAIWNQQPQSLAKVRAARQCFEAALRMDEANVTALLGLANSHLWEVNTFASDDRLGQVTSAEAAIAKAMELSSACAHVHFSRGTLVLSKGMPESALQEFEFATILDSNLAEAHAYIGITKLYLGRPEETEAHVKQAMRLSPRDPFSDKWYLFMGVADLYLGRLDRALSRLGKSVKINPSCGLCWYLLAVTLLRSGRGNEAAVACSRGRRFAPNFTIAKLRGQPVSDNPVHLAHREELYAGLRALGVPEQ